MNKKTPYSAKPDIIEPCDSYIWFIYNLLLVGCMIAGTCVYPLAPDPEDVMENYTYYQDIFCYSTDTMIRGKYPSFAKRM